MQACVPWTSFGKLCDSTVYSASSHLEAKTAAIEAAFVHGWIFTDKTLTEATLILEKQVAMAVVMQHALSQVQQGAQLAKDVGVGLHLPGIVCQSEKDAAPVCSDVTSFLDNV